MYWNKIEIEKEYFEGIVDFELSHMVVKNNWSTGTYFVEVENMLIEVGYTLGLMIECMQVVVVYTRIVVVVVEYMRAG